MLRYLLLAGVALAIPCCCPCARHRSALRGAGRAGRFRRAGRRNADSARAGEPGDLHAEESNDIVVTGFQRLRGDLLSGTSVVSGDQLTRDLRPTIGETLAHQPGVSATSFGPNASRPVLRGFRASACAS